jgi:hypothetical protein
VARSRLSTIAPDLDDLLQSIPPGFRVYAGWEAARWAVGRVGLDHPVIAAALRAGYSEAVPVLAAELDDQYLELQGRADSAGRDSPAVLTAFAHARAAAAVVFAAEDQAEEAVYEAALATDAVAELRPVVRAAALAE